MKKIAFLLFASAFTLSAAAQNSPPESSMKWGISAGWNQYKEPGLMQLSGPEAGLHGQINTQSNFQFEGEMLFGRQNYDSTHTGSLDNVGNIQSYWRALTPIYGSRTQGVSLGLAYHTLWNDLRGRSSTGNAGYQRIANQVWAPVRWNINPTWQFDAGLLVYGRHRSNLSEAGGSDIVNTQRHGHYAQMSFHIQMDNVHMLSPYVRYTHLGDSNKVAGGYEPASDRWQVGVNWEFGSR